MKTFPAIEHEGHIAPERIISYDAEYGEVVWRAQHGLQVVTSRSGSRPFSAYFYRRAHRSPAAKRRDRAITAMMDDIRDRSAD